MKEDKSNRSYSLIFDSWSEFVDFAAQDSPHGHAVNTQARDSSNEKSWTLGHDFDKCLEFGRNGWKTPVAEVEGLAGHVETKVETTIEEDSFVSVHDVSGSEVDIAIYLSGEPECMIESAPIRVSRHGRAVRVVVPHYTSCNVNAEAFRRRGAAIVALCDALAKRQHPVEVIVFYQAAMKNGGNTKNSGKWSRYQYLVPVQAANDPLDVERLLAATAHPGAFRRLGFAVMENTPNLNVAKGMSFGSYGSIASGASLESETDRLLGDVDNTILPPDLNTYQARGWDENGTAQWVVDTIDRIFD